MTRSSFHEGTAPKLQNGALGQLFWKSWVASEALGAQPLSLIGPWSTPPGSGPPPAWRRSRQRWPGLPRPWWRRPSCFPARWTARPRPARCRRTRRSGSGTPGAYNFIFYILKSTKNFMILFIISYTDNYRLLRYLWTFNSRHFKIFNSQIFAY